MGKKKSSTSSNNNSKKPESGEKQKPPASSSPPPLSSSDPYKDGTISNTTSSTSAVLAELYKPDDLLDKDDPSLVETDVDKHKPTDTPSLSLAQKTQNFQRFTHAMKDPQNNSAVRPFVIASVALFVLPMLMFHFMLRIVIPLCIFGEIVDMDKAVLLDEEVALGMDKITLSGVASLLVSWMVLSSYTLYAYMDNPPKRDEHGEVIGSDNAVEGNKEE